MALANRGLIKITSGGASITFAPASLRVSHMALSNPNSGRTADGTMYVEWTRGSTTGDFYAIPQLEIELPPHRIDDLTYSTILSHVLGQTYSVEYYDTMQHMWETTATFYTSEDSGDYYSGVILDGIVHGETIKAVGMYIHGYRRYNSSQLATPIITLAGATISWGAISGAASYEVNDNGTVISTTSRSYSMTTTTSHIVKVRAIATGSTISSDWSNTITYNSGWTIEAWTESISKGTVSPASQTVQRGSTATVTATPLSGFTFRCWKIQGTQISTNRTYTFTPSADLTGNNKLIAYFDEVPVYVNITAESDAPYWGSVSPNSRRVLSGTPVTFTATANPGYEFVDWVIDGEPVSTSAVYTFTAVEDLDLVATFEPSEDYVSITTQSNPAGGGITSGGGTFPTSSTVTLIATASPNYVFVEWQDSGGDTVSTNATFEFTADTDATYTAIFEYTPAPTPQLDAPTNAGVDFMGAMYWDSVTNAQQYRLIIQSPVPDEQVVTQTYYSLTDVQHSYTIKIRAEATGYTPSDWVTVTFTPASKYYISTQCTPIGSGTTTGDGEYSEGATVTLTATPALGYVFSHWEDDGGTDIGSTPTIQITAEGDITYTACFDYVGVCNITYDWNLSDATQGVDGPSVATRGSQITVSTEANSGYEFVYWWQWDDCDVPMSEENPWTVTLPNAGEYNIGAYFEEC